MSESENTSTKRKKNDEDCMSKFKRINHISHADLIKLLLQKETHPTSDE